MFWPRVHYLIEGLVGPGYGGAGSQSFAGLTLLDARPNQQAHRPILVHETPCGTTRTTARRPRRAGRPDPCIARGGPFDRRVRLRRHRRRRRSGSPILHGEYRETSRQRARQRCDFG